MTDNRRTILGALVGAVLGCFVADPALAKGQLSDPTGDASADPLAPAVWAPVAEYEDPADRRLKMPERRRLAAMAYYEATGAVERIVNPESDDWGLFISRVEDVTALTKGEIRGTFHKSAFDFEGALGRSNAHYRRDRVYVVKAPIAVPEHAGAWTSAQFLLLVEPGASVSYDGRVQQPPRGDKIIYYENGGNNLGSLIPKWTVRPPEGLPVAPTLEFELPAYEPAGNGAPPRDRQWRSDAVSADCSLLEGTAASAVLASAYEPEDRRDLPIDVAVARQGKQVVLVLSAYEPTTWRVDASAEIAGVILNGYYPGRVVGLPRDVPVVDGEACLPDGDHHYVDAPGDLDSLADDLREAYGLDLVASTTAYGPRRLVVRSR